MVPTDRDEILVVDDSSASLKLLEEILREAGYRPRLAPDGELALRSVRQRAPALILLDIRMPGLNGYEVCQRLKADEATRSIPIVFLSVGDDEEEKSLAFQVGAVDYVNKPVRAREVLARIGAHLSLRRAQAELEARNKELETARERLEDRVNERSAELVRANQRLQEQMLAIRLVNARFASVLRAATAYSIIATGPDGTIEVMNEGAELMLGYQAADLLGRATPTVFHDPKEVRARAKERGVEADFEVLVDKARCGEIDTREWTYRRRDGSTLSVSLTVTAMHSEEGRLSGFTFIGRDVTGEKELEQQLLQSQKIESVGLLSGGIAHDFNNLLTPIQGYSDLLKRAMAADNPLREYVEQIDLAAQSARELTYQLLAFSRKQLIELKPVDLAEIVRRSAKILDRTIRENVTLKLELSPSVGLVRADASQIEVVLVNLAVNAQDAMSVGGVLTIETSEVMPDEDLRARHPLLGPGRHVRLAVSDTGTGMDAATMARIFEPFFTTKEVGKGTGLGLSTAYGIVTQHGGSIGVSSQPGRGTTFEILLPRLDGPGVPEPGPRSETIARGSETILVVEDNQMVRDMLRRMLPGLGYEVLIVKSVDDCQALVESRRAPIHLLLTDVVMPGLNGRELYERLHARLPDLKVLFMSGYTTDVIGHHGVLDEGVHFLRKPFTRATLSTKIREALG